MQARLDPSEFAYLLNVLEAEKVVGVDNQTFFPSDPEQKRTLLSEGLNQLLVHGWFREQDGQISANNTLFLMSAVAAAPEIVLTATYVDEGGSPHTITFYLAEQLVVEQFRSAEGDYLLSLLDSPAALSEHIATAYGLPDQEQTIALSLPIETFAFGLAAAREGDFSPLSDQVSQQLGDERTARALAQAIGSLRPAGQIEGGAVQDGRLAGWGEIGLLRDQSGRLWLAVQDQIQERITLAQASAGGLGREIRQLVEKLTASFPK